jgi:hypothetical protein
MGLVAVQEIAVVAQCYLLARSDGSLEGGLACSIA